MELKDRVANYKQLAVALEKEWKEIHCRLEGVVKKELIPRVKATLPKKFKSNRFIIWIDDETKDNKLEVVVTFNCPFKTRTVEDYHRMNDLNKAALEVYEGFERKYGVLVYGFLGGY